ncbi:MAG: T9SS type A sorting domain-containing protein [Ignavibacteria bacterium]
MKNLIQQFIKICPKTGAFKGLKPVKGFARLFLPLAGFLALLWVLFRVVSKPSRINYPCVRAALPFASGFIAYITGLFLTALIFFKVKKLLKTANYWIASLLFVLGLGVSVIFQGLDHSTEASIKTFTPPSHLPFGVAKGIYPGRVVWIHDPEATNENCTLSQNYDGTTNESDDGWFLKKNNNQEVIDAMLSKALQALTGEISDTAAWNAIFMYYNGSKGKGEVGYNSEEKIFIKTNSTSSWAGNFNTNNLSKTDSRNNPYFNISETSPQVVLSVLRQLIDTLGVPQSNIYIGDPMKHIYKHLYDMWNAEYPDVHYLDHDATYSGLGREQAAAGDNEVIFYSDSGKILRTNVWGPWNPNGPFNPAYNDRIYQIFEDADYIINIPMLKGHRRAGITMFAKNHFGSHTRENASHLHNGLIWPEELGEGTPREGYGLYRVQVDLMGDEILGGKNLLYLMDALWAADHELGSPKKFQSAPFNNDWMSSIFLSLDPVAIESVGYDFLQAEFTDERNNSDGAGQYIQMNGVEDYLHQASDPSNWPDSILGADGIIYPFKGYDPEGDGTLLASLGAHEHWNNLTDKKYSRNLGTGEGIELVQPSIVSVKNIAQNIPDKFVLYNNYPNPFNPSTTIKFQLKESSIVKLSVYDVAGKLVDIISDNEYKSAGTYEVEYRAEKLSSGVYFLLMEANNYSQTIKMVYLK